MSQKWVRSKRWDDEHIPAALWPVKVLLRTFSSIPLAVVLLSLVAIYGTLASVPLGFIARLPTFLIVAASLMVTAGMIGGGMGFAARWLFRQSPNARFVAMVLAGIAGLALGCYCWWVVLWPVLRYEPATGAGLLLFKDFVARYQATTLRRLPGLEMSELEFYSWWPLRTILLLFVLNLVIATVRRIEFSFKNIGVLTVHTGIVLIALGSVYYSRIKQEGDTLLRAGELADDGTVGAGPAIAGFFDNTRVALWLKQDGRGIDGRGGLESRLLSGVPRYNDYNLQVAGGNRAFIGGDDGGRDLSLEVPRNETGRGVVDEDIRFRIVGYASYAELAADIMQADPPADATSANPVRELHLVRTDGASAEPAAVLKMEPRVPARRLFSYGGALEVEYTIGIDAGRWRAVNMPLPAGAADALVVEIPSVTGVDGAPFVAAYGARTGESIQIGTTGYVVDVLELRDEPELPIITPGYEGATSGVAKIRVQRPTPTGHETFDRWVYERFPEISQDFVPGAAEDGGMPKRQAADAGIRIWYIRAGVLQVYCDETPDGSGVVRTSVRLPNMGDEESRATVSDTLEVGSQLQVVPMVALRYFSRWEHGLNVEVARVVPEVDRDKRKVGTHEAGAMAVEVKVGESDAPWSKTVWLPFSQYVNLSNEGFRSISIPAVGEKPARQIHLAFGRQWHTFPNMSLQLASFKMTPYPHSDTPRDYESVVNIFTLGRPTNGQPADWTKRVASTSLNAPLLVRVPYAAREGVGPVVNFVGRLVSLVAPMQFKFSQAGWDSEGWMTTKRLVEQGKLEKPFARFTILGVGTNPGIYIIATGAVMMSIGIPWAFYLKPHLVQREKRRLQGTLGARPDFGGVEKALGRENVSELVKVSSN